MNNQKINTKPVKKTEFPDVLPKTPQHISIALKKINFMYYECLVFDYNDSFYLEASFWEGDGKILIRMVPTLENPLRAIYDRTPMIQMLRGKFFVSKYGVDYFSFLEQCMGCIVKFDCFLKTHEKATQNRKGSESQ